MKKQEKSIRKFITELRHSMPEVGLLQVVAQASHNGNFNWVFQYGGTAGVGESIDQAKTDLRSRLPVVKERLLAQAVAYEAEAKKLREDAGRIDASREQSKDVPVVVPEVVIEDQAT